ncbi:MAG: L-threonylcarbamoyladenylate synthase [Bryobacteraceae bacterium]
MPTTSEIERAARLIREGRLVAFPTETVYGLGANALDAAAVERIFAAKERPATSPLIVHVDSIAMARSLAADWPPIAQTLAERFWPGTLTLVVSKIAAIPDRVTAGLPTVGLRMPDHPVALALIHAAGVPIAAPSANLFMKLSPTTAEHVRAGLGDRVDMVLDGGTTTVGIESTVLSVVAGRAILLRPGMISQAAIEDIVGPIETALAEAGQPHASPGMHHRHYSPRTPVVLIDDGPLPEGRGAWVWYRREVSAARCLRLPSEPHAYAAMLYRTLHELDAEAWQWIAVEAPPAEPEWAAVRDRLQRAAVEDA